jgi:hypothetical protein
MSNTISTGELLKFDELTEKTTNLEIYWAY